MCTVGNESQSKEQSPPMPIACAQIHIIHTDSGESGPPIRSSVRKPSYMYSARVEPRRSRDFGGRGRGMRDNGPPRGGRGADGPPGRQYSGNMQGRPSSGPASAQPIEHIDREKV